MLRQGSLLYGGHFSSCITSRKLTPGSFFLKNNQFFFSWGVISLRWEMTPGQYSAGVIILLYTVRPDRPAKTGNIQDYEPKAARTWRRCRYIHSHDYCDKSWNTPCSPSCHKFASSSSSWKSHESATKLNFISDRRRVTLTVSPAQLDSPGFLQNQICF